MALFKTSSKSAAPLHRLSVWARMRRCWQLYVLLAPALIWVIVFSYLPMYGVQIAFRDFSPARGITGSRWVGLKHFIRFVEGTQFAKLLWNTVAISIYELIAAFPVPIILALCLNAVRQKYFSRAVQLITYAPNFISTVVVVGILVMLLDPRTGIVNHFIALLGVTPPEFLTSPGWFRHIYVWSGVWQSAGFGAIIYLATLTTVSPELHEAAEMDGANRLRRMWHIDLPAIMPVAVILLILSVGSILSVGFEKVLLLQNNLNAPTSEVIDTYVYEVGLRAPLPQFSYATAIGLFKSIIGLILLFLVNRFARKVGNNSLW